MTPYRIKDFDATFTLDQNRRVKAIRWIAIPLRDGVAFRRLLVRDRGPEVYGVFVLLVRVAATLPVRGTFADNRGMALDVREIAGLCGLPCAPVSFAMRTLMSPEIAWIEGPAFLANKQLTMTIGEPAHAVRTPCADRAQAVRKTSALQYSTVQDKTGAAHPARESAQGVHAQENAQPDPVEVVWKAFPKKGRVGKARARPKIVDAIKLSGLATVLAAVKAYAGSDKVQRDVVLNAATYFGPQKRWLDEPDVPGEVAAADRAAFMEQAKGAEQ